MVRFSKGRSIALAIGIGPKFLRFNHLFGPYIYSAQKLTCAVSYDYIVQFEHCQSLNAAKVQTSSACRYLNSVALNSSNSELPISRA